MSKSKYFGKSFSTVPLGVVDGKARCQGLSIGNMDEVLAYAGDVKFDEALVGLVDTLRVTRKLLKLLLKKMRITISDQNEFHREVVSTAKKIDELPEDVRVLVENIVTELFHEMTAPRPSGKKD